MPHLNIIEWPLAVLVYLLIGVLIIRAHERFGDVVAMIMYNVPVMAWALLIIYVVAIIRVNDMVYSIRNRHWPYHDDDTLIPFTHSFWWWVFQIVFYPALSIWGRIMQVAISLSAKYFIK